MNLVNLTSWWEDVALSQDSTKHQNALLQAGLIQLPAFAAKPELLLARVLRAFAPPDSLILELFARSADMAAVALKTGHKFIALLGNSTRDRDFATKCALPRLAAVVGGSEVAQLPEGGSKGEKSREEFLRRSGEGGYRVLEIGPVVATQLPGEESLRLNVAVFENDRAMMEAILTSEGFLVGSEVGQFTYGHSWDGLSEAVVLHPHAFMDQATAAEFASSLKPGSTLSVYYFRSADDFAPEQIREGITFRRVPAELSL